MSGDSERYNLEACASLQQEEWEVLEAIHPDFLSTGASKGYIRLEIPVDLAEPTVVLLQTASADHDRLPSSGAGSSASLSLTTLPPILLDISIPQAYPYIPPQIRTLHATHSWLPQVGSELRDHLTGKWEAGEGVLYTWVEWVRTGEFLDDLHLAVDVDGQRTIRSALPDLAFIHVLISCKFSIPHPTPGLLHPILDNYNKSIQAARFSQNSSCLEDFWKLCIKEGDVGRVGCPDPNCVKEHREATEEEVRRVVTEEEVLRWRWLRMKRALERDPTFIHCPMALCQTPVARAPNVEEGSPWERLRTCPQCGYSFCAYCKRTWHGPVGECPISATKEILAEYMGLEEDSPRRQEMEARYGRIALKKLMDEYEREKGFMDWLERCTGIPCPGCTLRVEKHSGCNHMTCIRCATHYCYRCGTRLDRYHPYKHFSTPGMRCYMKLFDVESIDDEWQPVEGFDVI
uniref:RBR-type E3 ubiquitin transferase n=1 Tax=Ganoderma boninense TaxID=34458 RepID=A0A5K1JXN4_9APHY|nr:Uncharacterized protein [Ganoderma boninense]